MGGRTQLVFHPPGLRGDDAFAVAVERVLEADSGEVKLISPYLGMDVVGGIIGRLQTQEPKRALRLITDFDECRRHATDDLLSLLGKLERSMRDLPKVHAKVVLSGRAVLFGSANLTTAGFTDLHELGMLSFDAAHLRTVHEWFDTLWQQAHAVSAKEVRAALDHHRLEMRPRDARRHRSAPGAQGSLGWMAAASRPSRPIQPSATRSGSSKIGNAHQEREIALSSATAGDLEELAQILRVNLRSRNQAEQALALLAEALEQSGLERDDPRLHLSFSAARSPRVTVAIGQRAVAWMSERTPFGLIADEATGLRADREGLTARPSSRFTKGKAPDAASIRLAPNTLLALPSYMRASWHDQIRREVARARTSSYRGRFARLVLFDILRSAELRGRVLSAAFIGCWWFGINQATQEKGHVRIDEVAPLLEGRAPTFSWKRNKSRHRAEYERMRPGDRALLWMGHDASRAGDPGWGLLGTARIRDVSQTHVLLERELRFCPPFTPYPKRSPALTENVRFLEGVLGAHFDAIGDVLRAAGIRERRAPPVTVANVPEDAFERIVTRALGAAP